MGRIISVCACAAFDQVAWSAALAAATDDAALVEDAGGVVRVVESFPENIKVTRESDLRIVEALLAD